MKIPTKYVILAFLVLFAVTFLIGGWIGLKKGKSSLNPTLDSLNAKISYYTVMIDGNMSYIAEKEQEVATLRQAVRNGDIKKEELTKLNIEKVNEITRLKLRIDTLLDSVSHTGVIVHVDTVMVDGQQGNALLLPFHFEKKDQWLTLYGTFDLQGELGIDLSMDAPIDVWGVVKKKGGIPSIMVTTENPYIKTLSLSSIKFDTPRKTKYGIGVQVGWGLTKELKTSPYIGVGLSYNLIRF